MIRSPPLGGSADDNHRPLSMSQTLGMAVTAMTKCQTPYSHGANSLLEETDNKELNRITGNDGEGASQWGWHVSRDLGQ